MCACIVSFCNDNGIVIVLVIKDNLRAFLVSFCNDYGIVSFLLLKTTCVHV